MANAKISDAAFQAEDNVRLISGIPGYKTGTPNTNVKITGQELVTSVINSNNSGTPSTATIGRIAFYGVGGDSLGGSSGLTWDQSTDTLALGVPGGGAGLNGVLNVRGNYIASNEQPQIIFTGGNSVDGSFRFQLTTSTDGEDQTWILPEELPSVGQVLKADALSTNDVTLAWADNPDTNTTYTLTSAASGDDVDVTLTGSNPSSTNTVKLVAGENITLTDSSNQITIDAASGSAGGITTLTAGATTNWDYTNGASAIWTPTITTPNANQLSMTNFPNGATGSLKIIPTNTSDFLLPANSKADSGNVTISSVNPSILYYFYDGSTFYWFAKTNMIDPIYLPNVSKANLLALWAPSSYEGAEGDVSNGAAWPNSYTQNNLLGDLTAVNTDTSGNFDVRFTARDDVSSTPAHFFLGEDGTNSQGWFNIASALGGNVNIGSWTGALWFQTVSGTNTSFNGLMDPDKDDDDAIYIYQRRIYIEGPNIYTNFPALVNAGGTGNENGFDLQDEWIYLSVAFNYNAASPTDSSIDFVIGCQATLDNASSTITGYDGTDISIDANGLYKESVTVTLAADTWNDFSYGAAVSTGGTVYEFEGRIALAAVYSTNLSNSVASDNWNATKQFYYIT